VSDALLRLSTAPATPDQGADSRAFRVVARGEIDMASASLLTRKVDSLIAQGATVVILDTTGVAFLDSTGLRAIIGASNNLSKVGGQLLIEGMSGAVKAVLEISGLLEHYRSSSDASADPTIDDPEST
jgi:anti-sigma B factor antagonist